MQTIWVVLVAVVSVAAVLAVNADDTVTELKGFGPVQEKQYAGYLNVYGSKNRALFYWFFEARHNPETAPVVLWLNGGPGCSSMTGLLQELGPYVLHDDLTLTANPFSWSENANMIFIDQPVGTGLSYTDDPALLTHDETEVSAQLYDVLKQFFALHPTYANLDFYASGESYAGKYVPALAYHIYQQHKKGDTTIKLKGILVGNGLVHPVVQRSARSGLVGGVALLSETQTQQLESLEWQCKQLIEANGPKDTKAQDTCNRVETFVSAATAGINLYDVRRFSATTNDTALEAYLNDPTVRTQLHTNVSRPFKGCVEVVDNAMANDRLDTVAPWVAEMHKADFIPMLFYNGQYDVKDGPLGTERWLLEFLGMPTGPRNAWAVEGEVRGYATLYGKTTHMTLLAAGHFVPTDIPLAAQALVKTFISKDSFCPATDPTCSVVKAVCGALNNCSGHGDCSTSGVCVCDRERPQKDDVVLTNYAGADCAHPEYDELVYTDSPETIKPVRGHMSYYHVFLSHKTKKRVEKEANVEYNFTVTIDLPHGARDAHVFMDLNNLPTWKAAGVIDHSNSPQRVFQASSLINTDEPLLYIGIFLPLDPVAKANEVGKKAGSDHASLRAVVWFVDDKDHTNDSAHDHEIRVKAIGAGVGIGVAISLVIVAVITVVAWISRRRGGQGSTMYQPI